MKPFRPSAIASIALAFLAAAGTCFAEEAEAAARRAVPHRSPAIFTGLGYVSEDHYFSAYRAVIGLPVMEGRRSALMAGAYARFSDARPLYRALGLGILASYGIALPLGFAAEICIESGYRHVLPGGETWERNAAGDFAAIVDPGSPAGASGLRLALGWKPRSRSFPLSLWGEYAASIEYPWNAGVLLHLEWGISLRYRFPFPPS